MTALPPNDPARQALQKEDEILAALDEMARGPEPSDAAPVVSESPSVSAEQPEVTFESRLKDIQLAYNAAFDRHDETELRRIAAEAKALIAAELARREKMLAEATDYFDEAVKFYGEDAPERQEAAQMVRTAQESYDAVRRQADDSEQFDAEAAIAASKAPEQEPTPTPATERPAPVREGPPTIEELDAAIKRLDALKDKIIRMSNDVRIQRAKAQAGIT